MTWTIERGCFDTNPITSRPVEVSRIWRFYPPPWNLVFQTPYHDLAERIVEAHNEEVTKAGEIPQLGLIPRRTVADALRRLLEIEPERFTRLEHEWVEHHIEWLEDQTRSVPAVREHQ